MKTKTNLIIIAIAAIVVCIIVACSLMFIDKDIHTINLNDYVTVEETGRDGYGSVSVSIDYNQLLDDYITGNLFLQHFDKFFQILYNI